MLATNVQPAPWSSTGSRIGREEQPEANNGGGGTESNSQLAPSISIRPSTSPILNVPLDSIHLSLQPQLSIAAIVPCPAFPISPFLKSLVKMSSNQTSPPKSPPKTGGQVASAGSGANGTKTPPQQSDRDSNHVRDTSRSNLGNMDFMHTIDSKDLNGILSPRTDSK
jgi:hypothetical protein